MREEEEQEERARGYTWAEETHQQQQGQDSNTDTQTPPLPLEYTHDTVYDNVVPFKHCNKPDDGAVRAEPDCDTIKLLVRELAFPMDLEGDWAEDINEEMKFNLQSEYRQATYLPSPPPPSPAPWYPPPPPTTRHRHPWTTYTQNHAWYNPPRVPHTSRRPPLPPLRTNQTGHVTMTVFAQQRALCTLGHLYMCPPHYRAAVGPPTGPNSPIPATLETGGTLHLTKSLKIPQKNARTARTGTHPAPTAPHPFGTHQHLPSHQLPLRTHHPPPQHTRLAPKHPQ
jgi:hypothetical protein